MNNERKDVIETSTSVYSIGSARNLVPVRSRIAYFKRKRNVNFFFTFLVTCLIVAVLVLAILHYRLVRAGNICDNEDCIRIAASLKESMDTSIDPCDDFYGFACGRWPKGHPNSESENSWFTERAARVTLKIRDHLRNNLTDTEVPWAITQAKNLYDSCMDIASIHGLGLKPLLELLERLNLPRIPAILTGEHKDIIEIMANVRKVLGKDVFIGFSVDTDPRDKSRNIVFLDTPSSRNPLPSYNAEMEKRMRHAKSQLKNAQVEQEETESSIESPEISYMVDVIREIVSNGEAANCSYAGREEAIQQEPKIKKAADTIYQLSAEFYHISNLGSNETVIVLDDNPKNEEYMLIDDIQKKTDEFVLNKNDSRVPRKIWRPFIEDIFRGVDGFDFEKDEVRVGDLDYLKQVAYLLDTTDDIDLETAIWWIVVDMVVPHSSKKLRQLWYDYVQRAIGYESSQPHSLVCADLVNTMMGMAVSWLFVERDFNEKKGIKVAEMLEDIRSAFASIVHTADWMDHRTKAATLQKSSKMGYTIGHPEWLFDKGMIDKYYEGIDIMGDSYLENMLSILNVSSRTEREQLHKPNFANDSNWVTDPTDVNALYSFIINRISRYKNRVSACTMLQNDKMYSHSWTQRYLRLSYSFHFMSSELNAIIMLRALNYGAIGTILGHELTHGFDNNGRLYDFNGQLRQWWSNITIKHYNTKVECFVNHYGSYYVKEVDSYVDGELTLGENIADNGGLREAVIAYKKWKSRHGEEPMLPGFTNLSHEQLVFLGFAHLWCGEDTPESLQWKIRDSHSPLKVRMHGVLRNSPEFSEAWNCPLGSVMNPQKKCKIW